jgi:hypothetical protein
LKSSREGTMRGVIFVLISLLCISVLGCAHHVGFQSPNAYQYESVIPLKAAFYMEKSLRSKMYYGRAASSGIANRWDVPVGDAVHEYALSYLKNGFAAFSEVENGDIQSGYNILIRLTDINYYMEGQAAHCDLTFIIDNSSDKQVFTRSYHADGPSGFGRVFWGGAFAQKSAIRQSTHVVLETIFKNLMNDIQTNYNNWELGGA